MFEKATRSKYRFPSSKGELTVEQLWDLPLQSRSSFDLDSVAKGVNQILKSVTEESFVQTKANPRKEELEDKMSLVKHIIQVKLEENAKKVNDLHTREQVRKLEEAMDAKQDQKLVNMTEEELLAKLKELKG